jgi:sugar O-acyltransferase (sialic acid O-acetyltransferase NeuD family)
MKKLILVGAGDWACEVYAWIQDAIQYNTEYIFKGFIDDNLNVLNNTIIDKSFLLNTISEYLVEDEDVFICVIANTIFREKAVKSLEIKGAKFTNAIHKSVLIFNNVKMGEGIVLAPYSVISNNSIIGNHVSINLMCSIGHDVSIGDYCQLSSHCDLTGRSRILNHVVLGSRVTLIPNVSVTSNTIIGAGSVVFRKIKNTGTYVGNPAKQIM